MSCIGKLVRGVANEASKMSLYYSVISMAVLIVTTVYSFWPMSTPNSRSGFNQLSWQEPFSYEAKVYASVSPACPVYESSSFFETAQLLWHIQPQSIENRYPLYRHKAVVNVPSQLHSGSNLDQRLYVHMFIQKAGQFGPHPNMSDPRLVSSTIVIARWKDGCPSTSSDKNTLATCAEKRNPELEYVPGASWAIVLEDNTYALDDTPSHIQSRHRLSSFERFYNPPLLRNEFTKSRPKIKPLAISKGKGLVADVYPPTIDVELELAGIKQDWILARSYLNRRIGQSMVTVTATSIARAPWNFFENSTSIYTIFAPDDGPIPLVAARRLSVPLVSIFVVCRELAYASLPLMIQMFFYLDSMPASRLTGISRVAIVSWFIGAVVDPIQVPGILWHIHYWTLLGLLIATYIAANMDDTTFAPLAMISRPFLAPCQCKTSPSTIGELSAQEQAPVATDKDAHDSVALDVVPMSHSERPDPIVAIRQSVDKVAMHWLYLLSIPVVVSGVVYFTLLSREYSLPLLSFDKEFAINGARIIKSVALVPQIIVNHRAKSGSLMPMVFIIYSVTEAVVSTTIYHMSGKNLSGVITAYSFPIYLSYVILAAQWIIYRKVKQD